MADQNGWYRDASGMLKMGQPTASPEGSPDTRQAVQQTSSQPARPTPRRWSRQYYGEQKPQQQQSQWGQRVNSQQMPWRPPPPTRGAEQLGYARQLPAQSTYIQQVQPQTQPQQYNAAQDMMQPTPMGGTQDYMAGNPGQQQQVSDGAIGTPPTESGIPDQTRQGGIQGQLAGRRFGMPVRPPYGEQQA